MSTSKINVILKKIKIKCTVTLVAACDKNFWIILLLTGNRIIIFKKYNLIHRANAFFFSYQQRFFSNIFEENIISN